MPTSETQLSIYNGALDLVAEYAITSTSDNRPEVRWLNRNWDAYRQMAIRANLWQFAREEHSLSADGAYTATSRWTYRYSFPNNALRLVPLTRYGKRDEVPIRHEVKGNKLFTNWGAPLIADFIMDVSDPGDWDPLFAQVMKASLAQGMAHRFTHKSSFLELATKMHADALGTAEQVDAYETGTAAAAVHDIILAREL